MHVGRPYSAIILLAVPTVSQIPILNYLYCLPDRGSRDQPLLSNNTELTDTHIIAPGESISANSYHQKD
jgi:hypothetical protein